MSIKKIMEDIRIVAADLDAAGLEKAADACDAILEEVLVSVAKETKIKTRTWSAGSKGTSGAKTRTKIINPSKARTRIPTAAGIVGGIAGAVAGGIVGNQSGSSHSEKEWNANLAGNAGAVGGEMLAGEAAKRLMSGPGAATARGLVGRLPGAAGGLAGSMVGEQIGYELGGETGGVAGAIGGWAAGAKATEMAGAGLAAAKGTLAGAGAAGAAGVALAGALGVAVGTLLVKAFPSLGSFGAGWVQKAIGTHDETLTDQIWGWLEAAMNSQNADDVIRNLSKAQLGLDMYEKEYAGELNRKELDGVANMMNAIGAVRGALPQEMQDLFDQRSAKMGRTLRRKK